MAPAYDLKVTDQVFLYLQEHQYYSKRYIWVFSYVELFLVLIRMLMRHCLYQKTRRSMEVAECELVGE